MPRISIIIPTVRNTEALETTLLSVLEHRPPWSEIVVVLGCVYEDPYDLKQEIRFIQASERATLAHLANCGVAAANSEIVHLLACGATVEEGWTTSAMRHFDDPRVAAVAAMVLDAALPSRVLAAGLSWTPGGRAAAFGRGQPCDGMSGADRNWIGPHLAGAYYRRSALAECEALDAALSEELAAIDLGLRLRKAGKQCVLDCESKVVVDARILAVEDGYRQARDAERLFWRHAPNQGRSLLAHGFNIASEVLRDIPNPRLIARLTGRVAGLVSRGAVQIAPVPPLPEPVANTATGSARRVDAAHYAGETRQKAARWNTNQSKALAKRPRQT